MAYVISVPRDTAHTLRAQLGGRRYEIALRWQPLTAYWYIGVREDDTPITTNRVVRSGTPLVRDSRFGGELYAWPLDGMLPGAAPDIGGWGSTHALIWEA